MPEADELDGAGRQPVAFISHHSSQVEQARHIARVLGRNGIKGWMAPDDIEPGMPFDKVIIEQISKCDVILLLFSASSDQSKHVKREVMLAEQHEKLIYPIRLESIQPDGLAYWLQDYQWIDWLDGRDEAIERMVATIRRQLSLPEATPPPAAALTPGPANLSAEPVGVGQTEPTAAADISSVASVDTQTAAKGNNNLAIVFGGIGVIILLAVLLVFIRGGTQDDEDLADLAGLQLEDMNDLGEMSDVQGAGTANAASIAMRPGQWQIRYTLTDYSSDFPGTSEPAARAVVASYSGKACLIQAQVSDPGTVVLTAFTSQLPDCRVQSGASRDGAIVSNAACLNPTDSLNTEVSAQGTYGPDTVNVEYDMSQWYASLGKGQSTDSTITMMARRLGGC